MKLQDWMVFWPIVVVCLYWFCAPLTPRARRSHYRHEYRRGRADAISHARRAAVAGRLYGEVVAELMSNMDESVALPYSRGWCAGVRALHRDLRSRIGSDDLLLRYYALRFGACMPAAWHVPIRRGV